MSRSDGCPSFPQFLAGCDTLPAPSRVVCTAKVPMPPTINHDNQHLMSFAKLGNIPVMMLGPLNARQGSHPLKLTFDIVVFQHYGGTAG